MKMYTPGIKIVEDYSKGKPHERFKLIYKNYRVYTKLVDSYEVGVYNSIICEKEYKKNGSEELIVGNYFQIVALFCYCLRTKFLLQVRTFDLELCEYLVEDRESEIIL